MSSINPPAEPGAAQPKPQRTQAQPADDLGAKAAECIHPLRDLHVTLLHLMGLSDNRLTYYHAGRFKQLSQFAGEVIRGVMA